MISKQIAAVMIDLSGTVHVGQNLLPGAKEAVDLLRENRVPFLFVSNNSKEPVSKVVERLEGAGLKVNSKEIFTSLSAAKHLVRKEKLRPLLLLQEEASKDWITTDSSRVDQYDAVVVGLAPEHFHYQKLTEAFQLLKQGARLVAINKSRYFQTEGGLALGAGAFVSALEYSADCKAEVVGKPSKQFFHLALTALELEGADAGQVLMVGDDIRDDVLGKRKHKTQRQPRLQEPRMLA